MTVVVVTDASDDNEHVTVHAVGTHISETAHKDSASIAAAIQHVTERAS